MFIVRDKTTKIVFHAQETEIQVGEKYTWIDGKRYANASLALVEQVEVISVPTDFMFAHYTYDGTWQETPAKVKYDLEQAVIAADKAAVEANESNLENDVLLKQLQSMTLDQVDAYIDNSFSSISNMDEDQIDTALTNLTTIAALKGAIKSLALDNVQTKQILKIVAKAAVYLIKKG